MWSELTEGRKEIILVVEFLQFLSHGAQVFATSMLQRAELVGPVEVLGEFGGQAEQLSRVGFQSATHVHEREDVDQVRDGLDDEVFVVLAQVGELTVDQPLCDVSCVQKKIQKKEQSSRRGKY